MMQHEATTIQAPGPLNLPRWYYGLAAALVAVGAAGFGYGLQTDATRAWGSYLIGFFLFLMLALAGPFFVATQYLTSAGWSVAVRRVPEAMSAHLVPSAALGLALLWGAHNLYHWTHPEAVTADLLLTHKAPYLNLTRMAVATVIAFAVWIGLGGWMAINSRRQDRTGDVRLSQRNTFLSAAFVVLFALTFSVVSFDVLMSLEPHWFSTMWAVYAFAMLMQAGMAFMAVAIVLLRRAKAAEGFIRDHHVHDVGKLTFAFTVFWAYIAFCQFLLIWYANLPEEITFFLKRTQGGWGVVALVLVVGKFFLPFLLLLRRKAKHTPAVLVPTALWILVVTAVELYWLVMPALRETPALPWMELLVVAGFLGVFLAAFGLALSRAAVVPVRDPRLHESLAHH